MRLMLFSFMFGAGILYALFEAVVYTNSALGFG
jgi:hypothetical protein